MSNQNMGWTGDDVEVDWDKVSETAPAPLEAAVYRYKFGAAEPAAFGKEDPKSPGAKVTLTVIQAYGSDEKLSRKMFDNLIFSVDGGFRVKKLAKIHGIELPARINNETLREFCAALVGCEGWLKSKLNNFAGKTNHAVDMYLRDDQVEAAVKGEAVDQPGETAEAPRTKKRRGA